MSKKVFVFLLVLLAVSTVFCEWTLIGEKNYFILSSVVYPAKVPGSTSGSIYGILYGFSGVRLVIGYEPQLKIDYVGLIFDQMIFLENGKIYKDRFYYPVRIRCDNKVYNAEIFGAIKPLPDGTIFAMFSDSEYVLKNMIGSKTMILELDVIDVGTEYFKFDLTGLPKAIDQLHSKYK